MFLLPKEITVLTDDLRESKRLLRLDSLEGGIAGRKLRESDYDRLVVSSAATITDVLTKAGLLEKGLSLHHLAGGPQAQIFRIDGLFAAVDELGQVVRLVVFEDKLLRNPESRRQALAQILDYATELAE